MSTITLSSAMARLGTETAFEVLAKARALEAQGRSIVHLEIGEPDFATPDNIVQAGIRALQAGETHYTPAAGILPLRAAVAAEINRTRHVSVTPDQVVVVPGGKPIIFFTIMALIEPGDEVIVPNPSYPIYESMANFAGAKVVPALLRMENDFRFDLAELRKLITPRTKLLVINSPANPTGGVLTQHDLAEVAKLAQEHNFWVLSDEIYSRILYGAEHYSIASVPGMMDRTIILDGFSKTYAMTGWRMGYGVMPLELVPAIVRLQTNATSCAASFSQIASVEALTGPQDAVTAMVHEFEKRRDYIVQGLNRIPGFRCLMPQGAFYAFPDITGTGMKSRELADFLLNKADVAALSGTAFGAHGEGFLRFSYANSLENIHLALERMAEAVIKQVA